MFLVSCGAFLPNEHNKHAPDAMMPDQKWGGADARAAPWLRNGKPIAPAPPT